jgi:hypothetical protein
MEGISFLVRVHQEEGVLEQSVQSLFALTIGYEILLMLNVCVGRCVGIVARLAMANPRVRILEYNYTVSRPGYETLATDYESVHSLPRFLNWGLEHAVYRWKWKWDADFVMPAALAERVNREGVGDGGGGGGGGGSGGGLWSKANRILELDARSVDGAVEHGDYASSCIDHYRKDVFWETPAFRFEVGKLERVVWEDVWIEHVSRVGTLKPYWFEPGWYVRREEGDGEEAGVVRERLLALERDFGMMPLGLGRSGTTQDAAAIAMRIVEARPRYVELWAGIP